MRFGARAALALGVGCALGLTARAQEGPIGNKAQLVVSAETFKTTVPGLEGVQLPPQAAALLGGAGGQRSFRVDLWTPGTASGNATASLEVPEGLKLSPTLELLIPKPGTAGRMERGESFELDRFWGSGEGIRSGQPRIYRGKEVTGDLVARWYNMRRRGAVGLPEWTQASWPNAATQRSQSAVPAGGALPGKYALKSSYVKPFSFEVPADVNFMEAVSLSSPASRQPDLSRAFPVAWKQVPGALGYMAVATGMKGKDVLVVWTSTEHEEDALQAAFGTAAGLQEASSKGVLLSPEKTRCVIPAGALSGCEGAMLQVIAFGPSLTRAEGNLSVRVQTRSIGMLALGHGGGGAFGGFGGGGRAN